MKPKMGVSDIYSLDAPDEVFMIYQLSIIKKAFKYFFNFTCLSLFNFALMALILLQFQESDVE